MSAAEQPPPIVSEIAAECPDKDRAEEALRRALAPAAARGLVVKVRIALDTPPGVKAEVEIVDQNGTRQTHEVLGGSTANCTDVARSVGAWVSGAPPGEALQPLPPPPSAPV